MVHCCQSFCIEVRNNAAAERLTGAGEPVAVMGMVYWLTATDLRKGASKLNVVDDFKERNNLLYREKKVGKAGFEFWPNPGY